MYTFNRRGISAAIVAAAGVLSGCGVVKVETSGGFHATTAAATPKSAHGPLGTAGGAGGAPDGPTNVQYVTVKERFPELSMTDSADLAKVKSAFERAKPDMFYVTGPCDTGRHYFNYFPVDLPSSNAKDPDALGGVDNAVGTPEHPYGTTWTVYGELRLSQRELTDLRPGTPVIVWSQGKEGTFVVTADGARYRVDAPGYSDGPHYECDAGSGKAPLLARGKGSAPAPIQHAVLSGRDIAALERLGQLPVGTAAKVEKARAAGAACSQALWDTIYLPKSNANDVANITASTRQNRAAVIQSEYEVATAKQCAPQKKDFEASLEAAITARTQARLALYAVTSAKIK